MMIGLLRFQKRMTCNSVGACGLNNTDVNTRSPLVLQRQHGSDHRRCPCGCRGEDGTWGGTPVSFPRIQGADFSGIVVAVGEQADDVLIGQRVLVDGWLRDWSDPMNLDRTGYFGSECDGGYAEFPKGFSQRQIYPIDCPLTDAELATFACSYVTAENMLNRAQVTAGDTVLVTGASGGVGSALVQLANRREQLWSRYVVLRKLKR
ncbi:MAG: hypothetical protein CM1200mP18_13160 [Gammaproteobacteria bacterium]|nr:MAG: hypothetical protein CM1200mP18_13160 [Gammaproteobacteria bacterium]